MKITFIGAGNMAEALVSGIIGKKVSSSDKLTVTDISVERLEYFSGKFGVGTSAENAAVVAQADVVVLSVKPQVFPVVWPEISGALKPDALVISIMAGIPSAKIAGGKPIRVVRVMPNTPSLVGEGAAGIAPGEFATDADVKVAETL
ncbi:MAG: NAD(P)-binding domain-containing protein, partial [Kiritimatiellales bacterium]|nr:NAD(P)-binding domain-containing protein [Kiritimatiellales bacterium]